MLKEKAPIVYRDEQVTAFRDIHPVAGRLAKKERIDKNGFRLIMNTGVNGGKKVFHLRLNLNLIGRQRMRHSKG